MCVMRFVGPVILKIQCNLMEWGNQDFLKSLPSKPKLWTLIPVTPWVTGCSG